MSSHSHKTQLKIRKKSPEKNINRTNSHHSHRGTDDWCCILWLSSLSLSLFLCVWFFIDDGDKNWVQMIAGWRFSHGSVCMFVFLFLMTYVETKAKKIKSNE